MMMNEDSPDNRASAPGNAFASTKRWSRRHSGGRQNSGVASSGTLVHTETTARYSEHRLHMTSVGRLSSPSAPATTPRSWRTDRRPGIPQPPPDTRSTVPYFHVNRTGNKLPRRRRYGPQHPTETSRQATVTRQTRIHSTIHLERSTRKRRSRLSTPSRPAPARPQTT
ncbi:MAG: hypothetical protein QOI89_3380 [Solirubrobacteraceae bacterium]|nr:hypothetical protein [Solirubrobacteraceae bacterium]